MIRRKPLVLTEEPTQLSPNEQAERLQQATDLLVRIARRIEAAKAGQRPFLRLKRQDNGGDKGHGKTENGG